MKSDHIVVKGNKGNREIFLSDKRIKKMSELEAIFGFKMKSFVFYVYLYGEKFRVIISRPSPNKLKVKLIYLDNSKSGFNALQTVGAYYIRMKPKYKIDNNEIVRVRKQFRQDLDKWLIKKLLS